VNNNFQAAIALQGSDVANSDSSPKPNQTEKPKKSTQTKHPQIFLDPNQTTKPNVTKNFKNNIKFINN
jgi:hypothetical protein